MLCEKCGREYFENIPLMNDCQVCLVCGGDHTKPEVDSFEWFLENKWIWNIDEISAEIQYDIYLKKKNKVLQNKRYYFMTLAHRASSKNKFLFDEGTISRLTEFCRKFVGVTQENSSFSGFLDDNGFPLNSATFCVESGKHEENPKLHVHLILDFKNLKNPNLGRFVRNCFNNYFTENKLIDNDEYDNRPFTECYLEDKLHYMINAYKDDHENFVDLGVFGGFGNLWSMLSNLKA